MLKKVSVILSLTLLIGFQLNAQVLHQRYPVDRSTQTVKANPNEKGKTDLINLPSEYSNVFIDSCKATNSSGSAADVGCAWLVPDARWTFWTIDDSATPDAIDDTTDAQDAGTGDVSLFTTTNDDGHMVCSKDKFGGIGYTVSQDDATNGTYALSYYNGTDYSSTVTAIQAISDWTAADHVLVFPEPLGWVVGSSATVGGPDEDGDGTYTDEDQYCMRVRATTAPSQATLGTIAWVLRFVEYTEQAADNGGFYESWNPPLWKSSYTKFLCYFSTANANNQCVINWRAN